MLTCSYRNMHSLTRTQEYFGGYRYVQYLDCGDGITGVCIKTYTMCMSKHSMMYTGTSHLSELCYIALHRYCVFLQIEDLCQAANLLLPLSQQHLLTSCFCITFW